MAVTDNVADAPKQSMLRLWAEALYTLPQVDIATVDPVTRWLILSRASVIVMSAISALIGGLLAVRGDVFDWPLMILTTAGLVLAHTASNLVNDFWDFHRGSDTPDSPRATYGPHPLTAEGTQFRSFVMITAALLAAATAIGVYLTVATTPWLLVFAFSGAFVLML